MAIEFYKMMQSNGAGGKISKIELVELTPEDVKKAARDDGRPGWRKNASSAKADQETENLGRNKRCQWLVQP